MGAVRLVFRAELRRRWKSWMAIALLIALVGGFVLAATAAGRRTDSAFPRFEAAYGFDAVGYASRPVPQLVKLPEVASAIDAAQSFERPTEVCLWSSHQCHQLQRDGPSPAKGAAEAGVRSLAQPVVSE